MQFGAIGPFAEPVAIHIHDADVVQQTARQNRVMFDIGIDPFLIKRRTFGRPELCAFGGQRELARRGKAVGRHIVDLLAVHRIGQSLPESLFIKQIDDASVDMIIGQHDPRIGKIATVPHLDRIIPGLLIFQQQGDVGQGVIAGLKVDIASDGIQQHRLA